MVISAPSGAGKTTIAEAVIAKVPDVVRSVSYTDRAKRPGEINKQDYFFVNSTKFKELIKKDHFLEWAKVHGHHYGTPRGWVEKQIAKGKIVILVIDVQGAEQVRKLYPESVHLFILPPSMKALKARLKKRNTESKESLTVRIHNAMIEYGFVHDYDYAVINDQVENAVAKVTTIINAEKCRVIRWIKPKK
jgi:guanylate kinase